MKIVISQPRYLPAINYIQRLYFSDYFILLDNVQRQSRGFENRNKLLIPTSKWLTMPIESSSREVILKTKIVSSDNWVDQHKKIIKSHYKMHPFFSYDLLDYWYKGLDESKMFVDAIERYLSNICDSAGFSPNMIRASQLKGETIQKGVQNIVEIVDAVEGKDKIYISGANGRDYEITKAFKEKNVKVLFHDWTPPTYKQYGQQNFTPFLPFLDYIFNNGIDSFVRKIKEPQEFNYE